MGGKQIKNLFDCYDSVSKSIRQFGNSENKIRFLELEYQRDILGSPLKAFHMICDFLRLAPAPVRIKNAKVNTQSITKMICNLQEVKEALKGTQYEWMTTHDEQIPCGTAIRPQDQNMIIAA